jgi:hypothetical protein
MRQIYALSVCFKIKKEKSMSSNIEGILAFSGLLSLAIGVIFLISSPLCLLIGLLIKDPIQNKKAFALLKKTLLLTAILLLVGTGICALEFQFYPLKIGQ